MIIKKYSLTIAELVKKARIKFDTHIDPLKLGSQFLLAEELKDYPKLIENIKDEDWQNFFKEAAKALKKDILED